MKIKDIIIKYQKELEKLKIDDANLKLRILLSNILNKSKEYIMIHYNDEISLKDQEILFSYVERLKNNEPIQYIINKQDFMGLEFFVNENVLIPQPDTECLVEEVLNIVKVENLKVLDLCTGSGAIAISIKNERKDFDVYASDISKKALDIAKENAKNNNQDITFIESNLFEKIDDMFDIIVSNPPYIERSTLNTLPEEVKKEPIIALDGGDDGLDFYRKIAENARKHLNKDGILAFEIGYNQKEDVEKILKNLNYKNIYTKKDLSENDRVVISRI